MFESITAGSRLVNAPYGIAVSSSLRGFSTRVDVLGVSSK